MTVNVNEFISNFFSSSDYRCGIFVPEDVRFAIMDCELNGEQFCEVPDNVFEVIEDNRRNSLLRDKYYNDVSVCRLAGMKAEDDDDIDEAIAQYAEAIEVGETCGFDLLHAYRHAYDRIFILLSRTRAYAREVAYIERLLKHELQDSDRQRLTARLEKTISKIK